MDLFDFKELFTYNHTVRQNYIHIFQKTLSWEDMVKNHEIGWLSLKDTLLHIMWAEDSWESIEDFNTRVISKVDNYLSSLTTEYLYKSVSRINKDGIKRNTIVKE